MTEVRSSKTGKIVAIFFVAIIILPACYALVKELLLNRADKAKTEQHIPTRDSAR